MGYRIASLSQTFARPTTATTGGAYTIGNLVANSTVAGSVSPMTFPVGANFKLYSVTVSSNSTVNAQAKFKVHLYGASPTAINGDNGVWLTTNSNYIDNITVDCSVNTFSSLGSGISGTGVYTNTTLASSIPYALPVPYTTIYALVTAAATWIPSSTTSLTVAINGEVNW